MEKTFKITMIVKAQCIEEEEEAIVDNYMENLLREKDGEYLTLVEVDSREIFST